MQAKKSVFRPIALAVSALISTGAFAQATVSTYSSASGSLVETLLGRDVLIVNDSDSMTQSMTRSTLGAGELSLTRGSGGIMSTTVVTSQGISTSSLSGSNGTLAVIGTVDFSSANVRGLTGSFNPAEVTSPLIGGTMVPGGTDTEPTSSFQSSGYRVDLSSGAATLGRPPSAPPLPLP